MTMELDQPPNMVNILVFWDHFTKHIMACVTPNQTAKTFAKLLWEGYILIFRAPAKLLSDWGNSFESNVIKELCELIGIWNVRTSPYHTQTNGHIEWAHQMLMCMIGKHSRGQKADWSKHLPELVQTYNPTRSAITRYGPHYLMFGCRPCLPSISTSLWYGAWRIFGVSTTALPSYVNDCKESSRICKSSPLLRLGDRSDLRQKCYYHFTGVRWLGPGSSWCLQGEEESKWLVAGGTIQSGMPCHWGHPFVPHIEWVDRMLMSSPTKPIFFSLFLERALPSVWLFELSGQCVPPPP